MGYCGSDDKKKGGGPEDKESSGQIKEGRYRFQLVFPALNVFMKTESQE